MTLDDLERLKRHSTLAEINKIYELTRKISSKIDIYIISSKM